MSEKSLSELVQEKLEEGQSATTNKATKPQVKARLRDIEKAFKRAREQLHRQQRREVLKLADRYAAEARALGKQHGFKVEAKSTEVKIGGGHPSGGLDINFNF
jgi:flagellar biosynthesis/type III secretory pathway protein FliH